MRALFLTGASGFVGRRLTDELARHGATGVRRLARHPDRLTTPSPTPADWRVVPGDLAVPGPWQEALAGVDTVVHLAALTGKASRRNHEAVNFEATRNLVEAARAAGVRRFLFVSTIAAGFEDRSHYHYADAKARAEAAARSSGLETLILRPTMVLGPDSPVLANLTRLAGLPIPIMFGPGREVQPIHVDDLAEIIVAALSAEGWSGATIELGGPERLPFRSLLEKVRAASGRRPRRPLRIPLEPTRTLLGLVEPVLLPVLPFTAGQLAAFANPSTAAPPAGGPSLPAPHRTVDAMVATVAKGEPVQDAVTRECVALVRYLSGRPPSPYVIHCYRRAVIHMEPAAPGPARIDAVLDAAVRLGRWPARAADAYARLVRPTGRLRRRLTLAVAILESAPETHAWLNSAQRGSRVGMLARVAAHLAASGAALAIGLLIFGPLHLWSAPRGGTAVPRGRP